MIRPSEVLRAREYLPPEVYGALSLAAWHWERAGWLDWQGRWRPENRRHERSAMRLEARARRLMERRGG